MIGEPQDMDAERSVLGSIFLINDNLDEVAAILRPGDFYRPAHRLVFSAMLDLARAKDLISTATVAERLRAGGHYDAMNGRTVLLDLESSYPLSPSHARDARRVKDMAIRRALIERCSEIARDAQDDALDLEHVLSAAESHIGATRDLRSTDGDMQTMGASGVLDRNWQRSRAAASMTLVTGTPTGIPKLDNITTGWHPGRLIILAARSGVGKSALAMNLASNAAVAAGVPVAVFSLEMTDSELADRVVSGVGGLDSYRVKTGRMGHDEWEQLKKASARVARAPLYVSDKSQASVLDIKSQVRRLKKRDPRLGLVICDYLQLVKGDRTRNGNREQEVASVSRGLKEMAKDLGVPVLALAQLRREVDTRTSKEPLLADLRESGAIEQDADMVMFLHRPGHGNPEADQTEAKLTVAKNRHGQPGVVPLVFIPEFSRFDPAPSGPVIKEYNR